ncbi:polysaccharide biosynthesis protein [Roseomonas sp. E05]|uniref:polysaccharide biosynthesis protein n=1 Tax=Roseomonas sp. E05 TaxID=3046310 RepID=UPI0024BA7AD0|nr:polysaccharide biosynthesis protein [Roseomonas sp. E05]MDJ0389129.1 polysaccharide biosynthesis protein [Roseomonas sp. E05]
MSADLIRTIAELSQAAPATPGPEDSAALRRATRALIRSMRQEGRLAESPMQLALTRTVDLHHPAAERRLRGKRVLVTGGSGCVGTRLRQLLAGFGPATLVNLDIAPHHGEGRWLKADIRDPAVLDAAFRAARPEVVFHLASIREPGKAELVVQEAVDTNVFGTANIITACRRHGVGHAVYSSTGKCYAYLTDHVYTASKKLAEMQWMAAAREAGDTSFAMTRFTHVLENGIVSRDIAEGVGRGMVGLHGPDRHFNIQNLRQATHLLVNALALAGTQAPDSFWSAVDLGWPVNTLELALFEIARSGRDAGVRFLGIPKGYDESFFRGQFDWSGTCDYHPLVNALEAPTVVSDSTGTMIGARVASCSPAVLQQQLQALRARLQEAPTDVDVKQALLHSVAGVTEAVFRETSPGRLLDILWWGAAPGWIEAGSTRFRPVMTMLADLLLPRLAQPELRWEEAARAKLLDIATTFAGIPGLGGRAERFQAVTQPLCAA